jgi:penicillin-binding protein-related factor A (putative recombinase)
MRKETISVQILKNSLELFYPGGEWIKIPDVGMSGKSGTRFMRIRPYDAIYNYMGNTAAFEVKTINGKTFNFSKIKDHQIKNLLKSAINLNNAFIVINFFKPHELDVFYFIEIDDFLYMVETYPKGNIKIDELDKSYLYYAKSEAQSFKGSKGKVLDLKDKYIMGE